MPRPASLFEAIAAREAADQRRPPKATAEREEFARPRIEALQRGLDLARTDPAAFAALPAHDGNAVATSALRQGVNLTPGAAA